ncbi:MAG: FAD-dependent monooxygenase, partial [Chloroflexi bacterium]|nr:FAD-dependent monooxygenase [Chloroflexota bacterium]
MSASTHRSVLVVGAGPVGLSCALALRANDVEVAVLEAEPEDRLRPGSRAIYTHRASLELLERTQPGLGRELG